MYTDYNVSFESRVNEYIIPIMIGIGLLVILLIIMLIGLSRLFKKANRSGVAAFIPVYNLCVLFELANTPIWQVLFPMLPLGGIVAYKLINSVVGILILVATILIGTVFYAKVMFKVAKAFRKNDLTALLAVLFPYVFIPIIGFGGSEYIGINREAFMGESVAIDLPVLTEKDIVAEEGRNVTETKPLDISIGGGVYQKEYKDSLLEVPKEKVNQTKLASFRVEQPQEAKVVEEPKEKNGVDLFNNINYVETEEKPATEKVDLLKVEPKAEETAKEETIPAIEEKEIVSENTQVTENSETLLNNLESLMYEAPQIEEKQEEIPVVQAEEPKVENSNPGVCPHCGFPVKPGVKKCFMCGKDL